MHGMEGTGGAGLEGSVGIVGGVYGSGYGSGVEGMKYMQFHMIYL